LYQRRVPVEVGETYQVRIEDMGEEGDGIARVDGFVVFVPGTHVDDNIKIRVTRVLKRYAFAEKVEE
jgi:predicted RNA-binding protein with TRAM domain